MTVSRRLSLLAVGLAVAGMAAAVTMAQTTSRHLRPDVLIPMLAPGNCIHFLPGSEVPIVLAAPCGVIPPVPSAQLTPGAIASGDNAEVCGRDAQGRTYSAVHRVWHDKRGTLAKYGLPWSMHNQVEDDDRIPVGLGGDNADPKNHWPESLADAIRKDRIEREKIRDVCDGRISLDAAQRYFMGTEWEQR